MRPVIAAVLFWILAVVQHTGQNAPPDEGRPPKITVSTQLIVETVMVKDKNGNPIEGLTAKDFTLTEDSVAQEIRFCEAQRLDKAPSTSPVSPPEPGNIAVYDALVRTHIASEKSGNVQYKDRRLLVLYFDMTAMQQADQIRALDAAQKFIRTQMAPDDLVSILRFSAGSVDVLQDFSDDRSLLLSILETMIVGEGQGFEEPANDASSSDTGSAFGQDDTEFNVFNTDRQLSALETAAKMLSHLREKKSLIYFASSLRLNGVDNEAQLHATIDAAVRAGVSFWPIDARGLVAQAPMGDATRGSPGGIGMYSGTSMLALTTNFQQAQDALYGLATETGGKALFDDNDLTKGIVQAQRSVSSYYILGYYPTNATPDGKFRRIKISMNPNAPANLDYRQGYYASKRFEKFNAADKERQLEDALMLDDPITDLTIATEIDYFQLNRAEYFVPIMVKIPGRELALARRAGARHTSIDFIGEIKDYYGGITVTNLRDRVNFKLGNASANELVKRPIEYDAGFTLLPGKYTIKLLARDDETGRVGTYQTSFDIPNLNREEKRIPISSVVLSSERIDIKDALYNAAKNKDKEETANPLVEKGQKLIPSVTRVFSKKREMYVYLQAYEQNVQSIEPLIAYVSFYRAGSKELETKPIEVSPVSNSRLKTVPLNFSVTLSPLPRGEYECQVTVLNPQRQKATFWQASVVLVP
jgi:VWFA-related protein